MEKTILDLGVGSQAQGPNTAMRYAEVKLCGVASFRHSGITIITGRWDSRFQKKTVRLIAEQVS